MKCFRHVIVLAWLIVCAAPLLAQGQATVLDPISPIEIEPQNHRPVVAADAQGNVMVVFTAKNEDGERVIWSLYNSAGAWSDAEVPLPAGEDKWFSFDLYDLAGRNGQFTLLLKEKGHEHYSLWSSGSWSTPVEFPDEMEHPRELGFDASGNLIAWDPGPSAYFSRLTGGAWQTIKLSQRHETHYDSCPPNRMVLGRTGALHLLGETMRDVLLVGSCPAGADPMQPASWVYQPPGYDPEHTGGATHDKHSPGYALDWPRQTLWMVWEGTGREDGDKIFVAHSPIGTTTEAGWVPWEIALPEGTIHEHYIVSSGAGAVGVAYEARVDAEDAVYFRWLPPTGLGQELAIVRPGSQTEAATFSTLYNGTMAVAAAPDGTAHLVIKGRKRGEYPENAERIYYSRITGGAVLQSEPGVQGGGTQIATDGDDDDQQPDQPDEDWQQQGGKPDLQPTVTLDDRYAYQRDGETVYRFRQSWGQVRPEISICNLASQYFGDVQVEVTIDGVAVHYVDHDESEHMRPMIERDDELDISHRMPRLKYDDDPEEGWEPPTLELADTDSGRTIEMHAPLGRKTIGVVVDPDDKIDEVNEDNNVAELKYEVSGAHEDEDRLRVQSLQGGPLIVGYNDLAIRNCTLFANTPIAAPGLIQAPAMLRMIVGNPRGASFFEDVPVAVRIDGKELIRGTIPLIDGEYRLHNREVEAFGWQAEEERRGPDIRGGFLEVPVDLANVDIGAHTVTVVIDPEDTLADLQRENNSVSIPLRVRERGGQVQVTVKDADTGQPVSLAHVMLKDLYFARTDRQGRLTIPDVPAGTYDPRDLWVDRPYLDPRYAGRPADSDFTVRNDQITLVTASLEQPVDVFLQVTDAETGDSLDAPPSAQLTWAGTTPWGTSDSGEIVGWRQGRDLVFPDCRPGACAIEADAYACEPGTLQADVHRDAQGECHLKMSLQRSPRGSVQVTVTDQDGDEVRGAYVSLQNAPRGATTDNDGVATIERIEAGRSYTAVVSAEDYTSGSTSTGTIGAEQTSQCAIQVAEINQREKTVDFDGIAWAQCESWPGFSFGPVTSDGYEVSAEHGRFHATLAVKYHEIAGTDRTIVDEVIAGIQGKHFWQENVTYEYSLSDIIGAGLKKIGAKKIAQLIKLAGPVNEVYDWLNGEVNPNSANDGEIVGTYTSWTGTEYQSETLIPIPSIPFSPGARGGQTVVRTDMLQVTDGSQTHTVRRQWYSPSMMVYRIGEEMDIENLEVKFFVRVLNERLKPGPLYANSRNLIHWKPAEGDGEDAWVRFHPEAYDELGIQ